MWEKEYKNKKFYWGIDPEPMLEEIVKYSPKGLALDIGAGEGRNSLFLAQNGFNVIAVDKIPEGLKKCEDIAKENNLSITTKIIDINEFNFGSEKYSLIISVASLSFLKKSQIEKIINKIKKSLVKNGVIYIKDFTSSDPMFKKFSEMTNPVEPHTFYSNKIKSYRYFFEKNELRELFNDYSIIYYNEYMQEDAHPDPHFHGIVEIVAQNKKDS